ncbi:MAG: hypothetical protein WC549_01835 [Actinomycetota bacterium]
MFRNREKYLQQQIDDKSKTLGLNKKPNPKDIEEGSLVYVDNEGLYVKFRGELKLITAQTGNIVVNSNKSSVSNTTIQNNNSYSVRLSHIVEFFNGNFITLSQQFGNMVDSIKVPIDFTKINKITCYITVSDGNALYQKYVDVLNGTMIVNKGNSLEIAIQYDADYKLRLRITEKNLYFKNLKQGFFSGNVILNDGEDSTPDMQTVYDENKLIMFLEMLINVS